MRPRAWAEAAFFVRVGGSTLVSMTLILITIALVIVLFLLAFITARMFRDYPASELLDWKPTRSPEVEAQNEIDDVRQMLDAQNEYRRKRGADEITEADVERQAREDEAVAGAGQGPVRAGRECRGRRRSGACSQARRKAQEDALVGEGVDRRLRPAGSRARRGAGGARLAGARDQPLRPGAWRRSVRPGWSRRGRTPTGRGRSSIWSGTSPSSSGCWDRPTGEREELAAIHGPRLERLLEKLVDTPVRGFAYEDEGSVPAERPRGRAGDRRVGFAHVADPGDDAGERGGRELGERRSRRDRGAAGAIGCRDELQGRGRGRDLLAELARARGRRGQGRRRHRPRGLRALGPLRPRRPPAERGRLRRLRARPSRPRELRGRAREHRPHEHRRRRRRHAGRDRAR